MALPTSNISGCLSNSDEMKLFMRLEKAKNEVLSSFGQTRVKILD